MLSYLKAINRRKLLWFSINLLLLAIALSISILYFRFPAISTTPSDIVASKLIDENAGTANLKESSTLFLKSGAKWRTINIKSGDSLYRVFDRQQLSMNTMRKILNLPLAKKTLLNLKPSKKLELLVDPKTLKLQRLLYPINYKTTLSVTRLANNSYVAKVIKQQVLSKPTFASAVIQNSLYAAGRKAKITPKLLLQLAAIFAWDIDFARSIRPGDSFKIIYQKEYIGGKQIASGPILIAEFTHRGKTYTAIRFTGKDGLANYYTPAGHSVQKSFLRKPLKYKRISSPFADSRKHPILARLRPHHGVDLAAPTGTPIKATGNGKVVFRGVIGGYGNVIIMKHGDKYTTLYAHMRNFAKGIQLNSVVTQGQTIGYVGSSGLATGPHLHYEFRINGKHFDPMTVKFPSAKPVSAQYRVKFKQLAKQLLAELQQDQASHSTVA